MANKKTTSAASKPTVQEKTTTKVTTVKAVESHTAKKQRSRGEFLRKLTSTPVLASALAEFVGAFLLTAIVLTQQNQPIAVLFGALGIVLLIGGLSGAHFNPIATVGAWTTKRIDSVRAVSYLIAQTLGAMLALVVLNAFIAQAPAVSAEAASLGQAGPTIFKAAAITANKEWALLYAELLGAMILGLAYASALRFKKDKAVSALTIAAGYFVALVVAGTVATYTSASVILNPVVAIAAEAINFKTVWPVAIYVLTSIVGGVLGFALYDLLKKAEEEKE